MCTSKSDSSQKILTLTNDEEEGLVDDVSYTLTSKDEKLYGPSEKSSFLIFYSERLQLVYDGFQWNGDCLKLADDIASKLRGKSKSAEIIVSDGIEKKKLTDNDVCSGATFYQGTKKVLRSTEYFRPYINEAKRRGLSCGVGTHLKAKSVTKTAMGLSSLSNSTICNSATRTQNNKTVWDKTGYFKQYVNEAKRRGLSCGVSKAFKNVNIAKTTEKMFQMSDELLCSTATSWNGQKKDWVSYSALRDYVLEAKRRGLSCGVSANTYSSTSKITKNYSSTNSSSSYSPSYNSSEAKSYFKRLKSFQRKAIQQVLFMDGLYNSSIDGLWGAKTDSAVRQASKNKRINSGSEVIKKILREANQMGITQTQRSNEARVAQQRKAYERQQTLKAQEKKKREGEFTACYGFCIMTNGFQASGRCAAYCGGARVPEYSEQSKRYLGVLAGEIAKGTSKVCLYNNAGSIESLTVGAASICPLTN